MTNQEILTKVIQKAIDNGWQPLEGIDGTKATFEFNEQNTRVVWRYKGITALEEASVYGIIFNHDFAKVLWGEHTETMIVQNNTLNVKQVMDMDGWRYHLQQLVIADDPIKYLGAHLD